MDTAENKSERTSVVQEDIENALHRLDICRGDLVLVHSSLSSFGYVEGGADTVINAFLNVLGDEGTLVMPTLIQKDFQNAYKTWYIDKPSDVGYITEVFRKYPGVIRSDQATHSVAAYGRLAHEITKDHGAYGRRYGTFGDTAFAVSSPWQKMYDLNAKVVLIGVDMNKNTLKHLTEYCLINDALDRIPDESLRMSLKSRIKDHPSRMDENRMWFYYDSIAMQKEMDKAGLIRHDLCGNSKLLCYRAKTTCDFAMNEIKSSRERWMSQDMVKWFDDCAAAAEQ